MESLIFHFGPKRRKAQTEKKIRKKPSAVDTDNSNPSSYHFSITIERQLENNLSLKPKNKRLSNSSKLTT